ncbi:MAG TPA: alanine racemase [Dongiaceae bacterium]|jgi:alanine racemase|nr:alanine racemase [Dongiaceae bacterium]
MRPRLTVDCAAIADNYRALVRRAQPARVAGIVKANAYGLGATSVAPVLYEAGCRDFFVADLTEANEIAPVIGSDVRLFLLSGLAGEDPRVLNGFVPVLNTLGEVLLWTKHHNARAARPCALHIDTGLSRLGLPPAEWVALRADVALMDRLNCSLLMSHLACADQPGHPMNDAQHRTWREVIDSWPTSVTRPRTSLAASAGIYLGHAYHYDLVRPGGALYGLIDPVMAPDIKLAVTLEAPIIQIRSVDAGGAVGYGATHSFTRPGRIAILQIGYADGLFRALGNAGNVIVHGRKAPIVGRVSMDVMAIDVTAIDAAAVGDYAEIFGPTQTPDALAVTIGTIGYELTTGLGPRVERRYVTGAS